MWSIEAVAVNSNCQDLQAISKAQSEDPELIRYILIRTNQIRLYYLLLGYFAYIDDSFKARLESPLLPWKALYRSVGLCLGFNYFMPTKSKSTLKVLFKETEQETTELVWQLVGYHGLEWSAAQVALPGVMAIQVGAKF